SCDSVHPATESGRRTRRSRHDERLSIRETGVFQAARRSYREKPPADALPGGCLPPLRPRVRPGTDTPASSPPAPGPEVWAAPHTAFARFVGPLPDLTP